jgi:diaminohydroxyphosphoribosylaminopyrimidine deaminase/5-amino-6-(5-phosphoribosylamino)uracil reductase
MIEKNKRTMDQDQKYIKECIELAGLGEGKVSPNPLVGAVVLDKDSNIVGKGYHEKYGEAHAEINALNEAGEKAREGTLYINLEPCSHYGKTPPCVDRVIEAGIKRLVIGMTDPNPLVAGNGIKKAQEAGIEIKIGVLEQECKKLNEIFIKYITKKQPFIAIKTASTMDGKIATKTKSSKWITSSLAREKVQELRNKYDAIITGSGTIIADDPSLTCRMENGRNPVRIIIAASKDINDKKAEIYPQNVEIWKCPLTQDGKIDLNYLVNKLYQDKMAGILVEAGGLLNGAFIKNNLSDKFYFFIAPKILGDNQAYSLVEGFDVSDINQSLNLKFGETESFSPDIMIEGYL